MAKTDSPFTKAVESTPGLAGAIEPGLQALGVKSSYVKAQKPGLIDGSVDIDSALRPTHPDDARWDYAIGYRGNLYFVEIHPADTSNVDEMIKKVTWLKKWLATSARGLASLHRCEVFHWIPSGRVKILKNSTHFRKIAKNHLIITGKPMPLA